jgi:hypothetical protein
MGISYIENRDALIALQNRLGVRHDWHEPDNNDVSAFVVGDHLDNAMGSRGDAHGERVVKITKGDEVVAAVNLATLLAFACGTYEGLNQPRPAPPRADGDNTMYPYGDRYDRRPDTDDLEAELDQCDLMVRNSGTDVTVGHAQLASLRMQAVQARALVRITNALETLASSVRLTDG